jgi:hypothetical protein
MQTFERTPAHWAHMNYRCACACADAHLTHFMTRVTVYFILNIIYIRMIYDLIEQYFLKIMVFL